MRYNKNLLTFYEFLSKYPPENQVSSKLVPNMLIEKVSYFWVAVNRCSSRSMSLYGDNLETVNDERQFWAWFSRNS